MGARPEDYERQAPYKSYIHVDQFAGELTNTYIEMNMRSYNQQHFLASENKH